MAEIPINRRAAALRNPPPPPRIPESPPRAGGGGGCWLLLATLGALLCAALLCANAAPARIAAPPSPPAEGSTSLWPSPTPGPTWEVAVAAGARVRAGPGTSYRKLCSLRAGIRVEEIGRHVQPGGPDWLYVRLPEGVCRDPNGRPVRTGWIREDLLRPSGR